MPWMSCLCEIILGFAFFIDVTCLSGTKKFKRFTSENNEKKCIKIQINEIGVQMRFENL